METFIKIVGAIVLVIMSLFLFCLLISIPVWLLWNWIIPVVFPGEGIAHSITLLQALGITLLCGCLFKSSSASVRNKS